MSLPQEKNQEEDIGESLEPIKYSYTSTHVSFFQRIREIYFLIKNFFNIDPRYIKWTVDTYRVTQKRIAKHFTKPLDNLDVLDIGPGQQLRYAFCWSGENRVTGLDTDVIVYKPSLKDYIRMFRTNSLLRVMKTLFRKFMGYDNKFIAMLEQELGKRVGEPYKLVTGYAENSDLPKESFDIIYSYSVFEHIQNPEKAIEEIKTLLKPGGVVYISLHLYTSHSGIHDAKIFSSWEPKPPYWAHLRENYKHVVTANCYLNEYKLKDWEKLFAKVLPNSELIYETQSELADELKKIKSGGELKEYSDQELLTLNLVCVWKKDK